MTVRGEFTVAAWNEENLSYFPAGMPVAKASIVFEATGEVSGRLTVEYLLQYSVQDTVNPHNSQATYTGYMFLDGSIGGKTGTVVIEDRGSYTQTGPASVLRIKPGTGTGELAGVTGTGKYGMNDGKMIIEFDLD